MRLLAINFGGIGDEVLFLPTLKSIKTAHPDWHITLLTEPRSKSITQLTRLVDANIVFDIKKIPLLAKDYIELVCLLRAGKYDIVLSSGSSSKVSMLLYLSGIPKRIGYDSGLLSHFLLSKPVKLNREQYAAFMYEELVQGLNITPVYTSPQIDLDQESLARMTAMLESERDKQEDGKKRKRRLVLIHPGTSRLALQKGIFKTWANSNWCKLIERLLDLDCEVLLCGGPDDEENISEISKELGDSMPLEKGLFINAFGKTSSLKDLAALMEIADLVICVDSAPMHIAAALQKRLVALFGPTDHKKLLLTSDRAIALQESESSKSQESTSSATCVQIQLDTVYQTAVDQLNRVSVQESSLEFHRS